MTKKSEKVIRYRKNIKHKMILAMGGFCQKCGYSRCNDALEFHHIDPSKKEIAFGKLRSNPQSLNKVLMELEKCILLCSICHRELHANIIELPTEYHKLDPSIFGWSKIDNGFIKTPINIIKKVSEKTKINKEKKIRKKRFDVSFEELSKLLNNNSYIGIGKIYGVSDNAIRKRAILLGIELKSRCLKANKMTP